MMQYRFQPRVFLLLIFLSILIMYSWTSDVFNQYWRIIDNNVFYFLNSTLGSFNDYWSGIWAILSVRAADLITLIIISLFFYFDGVLFSKGNRIKGLIGFTTILFVMLIVREFMDFYIEIYDLNRQSPSLVMDSVVRLSEIYPNISLKDSSPDSFPGDHAAVLFTWFGYCIYFTRNKWSLLAALVVIVFTTPRLIAGAHWFSDVAVGGLVIALVTLSIGLYTPLLNKIDSKIVNVFYKIVGR